MASSASSREMMKSDVRLLKRAARNRQVTDEELDAKHRRNLTDSADNARWMHPDGTPCDDSEIETQLSYHEEGKNKLFFAKED